jgi:hypothetical protein
MPHANHRLAAREHLAEAAAVHAEGDLGSAVRHLRAAATAAVAAMLESAGAGPDRRLLPPVAADALGLRGVVVADVRAIVHDLHDCHAQDRGRATEFTARAVAEAIAVVQTLVDLTCAALPRAAMVPSGAAVRAPAQAAPAGGVRVPDRPEAWLRAARRRRLRTALLSAVMAALLAGGGTAAVIAGERDGPRKHLDVMARARGLSDLAAGSR